MKRIITISLMALTVSATAIAQPNHGSEQNSFPRTEGATHDHEGRLFAGGAISFWNNKGKKLTLDFCPEIGYLFNDNWGVGLLLGYEYENRGNGAEKTIGNAFKISPFARYYYFHRLPFNLYVDVGGGFNFSREKVGNNYENMKGVEIGVRPGACVDLTEGLCLCLRMGFIGYRHNYVMGEEPNMGDNGFGFRFAPEELMIGLELEF